MLGRLGHALKEVKPSEASLCVRACDEDGNTGLTGTFDNHIISNITKPFDAFDAAKASHGESIQFLRLVDGELPGIGDIKKD